MNAPIPRIEATHPPGEGTGSSSPPGALDGPVPPPVASRPGEDRPAAVGRFEARRHVEDLRSAERPPERAEPAWQRLQDRIWGEFPGAPHYLTPLLMVASLLFGAIVVIGFVRVLSRSVPEEASDPRAAAGLPAERSGLATILDPIDEERAFAALAGFLEADGWESKLGHVRRPYEVGDLMARYYRDPAHQGEDAARSLGARIHAKPAPSGTREFIVLAARVAPEQTSRIFFVEKVDDDLFKVDWESSVGHQAVSLEEFQRTRPVDPVPFRVQVRRSDYYNFAFADPEGWLALELTYPGQPAFHLYAYSPRGTLETERLEALLPEGIEHRVGMIVELAYPDEPDARPEQAVLTGIVSDSWFPH